MGCDVIGDRSGYAPVAGGTKIYYYHVQQPGSNDDVLECCAVHETTGQYRTCHLK